MKPPNRKGAKMSEDSKQRISETCKKQGVGKWMLGRKMSEVSKLKNRLNSARHWLGKKRLDMCGVNHPLWKEERTPKLIKNSIRHSFEYRQWRSDIFTKDNFTCQICNRQKEVSGKLNADHYPKSFASILAEYKIKSLIEAISCEELWSINNGRTLCKECHEKTDNYFFKAITKGHRRDLS